MYPLALIHFSQRSTVCTNIYFDVNIFCVFQLGFLRIFFSFFLFLFDFLHRFCVMLFQMTNHLRAQCVYGWIPCNIFSIYFVVVFFHFPMRTVFAVLPLQFSDEEKGFFFLVCAIAIAVLLNSECVSEGRKAHTICYMIFVSRIQRHGESNWRSIVRFIVIGNFSVKSKHFSFYFVR